MPFGCVPIRQLKHQLKHQLQHQLVSNAFRLCAYSAGNAYHIKVWTPFVVSPMPFGCVPIRQYIKSRRAAICPDGLSPMPFGCVPIRQSRIR